MRTWKGRGIVYGKVEGSEHAGINGTPEAAARSSVLLLGGPEK